MKILYLNIILFIGIMVFSHVYIDKTIDNAIRCGHIDRVPAKKIWTVWQGKNGNPDEACLVEWTNNGKTRTSEWWNVGNCNENIDIEISVHDYTCH
jgi:hypothetical protein